MWLLGQMIYCCLLYQISGANYLISRHFKIRHISSGIFRHYYKLSGHALFIYYVEACWETTCNRCELLSSYFFNAEKCRVDCGEHHCHKQLPGVDNVWSFKDAGCDLGLPCCSCCHCQAYPCSVKRTL